ncbi:catenin alpha-2 [Polymixia lowei]
MALVDHGLIKAAAAEQVVAPIAGHLCHLVLLCESADEPEHFTQLEAAAQTVAEATKNMAAVASRQINETSDEVMQMEMSSLLESVTVSGQHVLLAAQKLSIQPSLAEHREELITATQNVFLGVVKVLLVDDDATVRKILVAADRVLECLSVLGSSLDIRSLLTSFQVFSDALLLLNNLTVERANSLQDPRQTKQLLDSLETLRKCISMLHTAMCTTIKHPGSEQAQEAKRYILDKVETTVKEIISTLKSECHRGSLGPCGYYTGRRDSLLQLLASFSTSTRGSGFDSMVRDLVFHCMVVANSSRRELQQRVVCHCRHVLQLWSDITRILKFSEDPDSHKQHVENICTSLIQQIQLLDEALMMTVLYQALDTFLAASSTFEELVSATTQILDVETPAEFDLDFLQLLLEDFISHTDRIIQVANFISALAIDAKSLDNVENSRMCFTRLRAGIATLALELCDNSLQPLQKLRELCERWEEETSQLQEALSDVLDVHQLTLIAIHEMGNDRRECDAAYKEQSCELFDKHAKNLICHMRQVIQSVKRHLNRSDNPIYRNGLLVLLKQVQTSQTKVAGSARDMLAGPSLNVETAQETAMSSGMSTESIFKHSVLFSDLINNIRKVLLPVAGNWYHAINTMLHDNQPNRAAAVAKQLSEISDIVSSTRLMVVTRYLCDTLSLEVQIQCWSAKAHYVAEEINKLDGIHQGAKENIKIGLQGRAPGDDGAGSAACKDTSSLTYTSLFLKQETDSWDPRDNRIVQVTRKMADKIYYMTQYLRKKGPIPNKEAFVITAKDVISNGQSITQFVRVIANHCLDKQCTTELSLIVEQILTISNQLNIISRSEYKLQTLTTFGKGLRQPEPNSDDAEAAALCFQWKRNLQIHRAQQNSNPETDDLGLRKTSSHPAAPSLAPSIQDTSKSSKILCL